MLVSSVLCVVALLSSTVEARPAAARRDDLETASSLSIGTPSPTPTTLNEDALVVPLFDLDEEPAQARPSYLLLRPTTSLSFDLADASLPTDAPLLSVSPTLFITLAPALPQTPTPTSDPASPSASLLLASPSSPPPQQQQQEEEEPTTTRAGVIASSLVGAIVGMGLLAVVWCLVRARVLKKRFKKERQERERERDLEGEKGGEGMSLDLEEKVLGMDEEVEVLEKEGRDETNVEVLVVSHSSPSIFSDSNTSNALPLPPTSSPSLPDFSYHSTTTPSLPSSTTTTTPPPTARSQSNKLTTPPSTAQSTSTTSEGNHRTRTTTGSSGVTIDSYYTSPAVSPAFGTERWDGRPSTATSGTGRAV